MTVKELINELMLYDENAIVRVAVNDTFNTTTTVFSGIDRNGDYDYDEIDTEVEIDKVYNDFCVETVRSGDVVEICVE